MGPILQFAQAHPNALIATTVFFFVLAVGVIVSAAVRNPVLRVLLWFFSHTLYRMHVMGREHVPRQGGALLVSNHTSFVDVLLLMASSPRPTRFLMFKDLYDHPLLHPFARLVRAIPISPQQDPREMLTSLHTASAAIRSGEIVCIFAEGQITRIGQLLPFRRGLQRIMKGVDAPIIPVHIDGMWGSVFSFDRGRFLWKWPKALPYSVTISYGRPMPATATPADVRTAVQELSAEAYSFRRQRLLPLHRAFVRNARRYPFRFCIADMRVERMNYLPALIKSIFLAGRLREVWRGQEIVAVMLPPSVACALVNVAASMMGKAVVNLNYTVSSEVLADCMKQIDARNVVTSHAFLEKVTVRPPGELVLLEELALNPRKREKLKALLLALFVPVALLEKALGRKRPATLDELATAEGRDALAWQRRRQCRPDGAAVYHPAARLHAFDPADLPCLRLHRHAVAAAGLRHAPGVLSQPARWTRHRHTRAEVCRHLPAGDADVPPDLHPALRRRGVRQPELCDRRRREAARAHRRSL